MRCFLAALCFVFVSSCGMSPVFATEPADGVPLSAAPFLVVVCPDEDGRPGQPQAFVTAPHQGVCYARGTWHGVLTPFGARQDFVVIDRGGPGAAR